MAVVIETNWVPYKVLFLCSPGPAESVAVSECKSPVNINVKCMSTNKCRTNPVRKLRWSIDWGGDATGV